MKEQLLLDVLMVLFTVHIIHTYLATFHRGAIRHQACHYAAWIAYILFQFSVMFFTSKYPPLTLFGNIILMAAILHTSGCGDIRTALFRSCILYASWMAVDVVTQSILLATLSEDPFVVGNLISTIAMYIIVQMYKRWKGRDFTAPLSFHNWIRLVFVPISSMLITYYAYAITLHSGKTAFFYFLSILIVLINYLIFDVYDKMSSQALIEKQNQAYEQEIHLCVRQAADREEAYRQTRILRHDLKGRLIALSALLEAGQTEETQKEIKRMLSENSLSGHGIAETGNLALDAFVNYKHAAAAAKEIQLKCRLDVPAEIIVEGTDLCVILENLLNNALEAVQKLPKRDQTVNLTVQLTKGIIMITVENPYRGNLLRDSCGKLQSSKSGDHGIGLLSVERTAKKYNGEVVINCDNDIFRATVMLCPREILHGDS